MAAPLPDPESIASLLPRPLGLFSDVDGTLSPIAPTPGAASLSSTVLGLLEALAAAGVLVALLSGRRAQELRRWVGLEGVVYVGNHGLEWWEGGRVRTVPGLARYRRLARTALAELGRLELPGLLLEDKEVGVAVHYRLSPSPEAAREAVLAAIAASPACRSFWVLEGKMVLELRPPLGADKGTAALDLARRHRLRGALALGDDITDVPMFRRLRRAPGLRAVCVAVAGPETPPLVLQLAHYRVEGVEGVETLLRGLLRAFAPGSPPTGP
ncbi:MAG TPA: trehalose-phosphatase [Dehalococcoidia bacterium]|nr:trehalose-phosphatase [Dehalococcoidia bacterium]